MNTEQIQCAINKDKCLSSHIKGVFSPDTLPKIVNMYPSAYICNTEDSHLPGKHWVVFWFQSPSHVEFYDSFGKLPQQYSEKFETFLNRNAVYCLYNNVPVQREDADTCGYHILFYLLMKCNNVKMITIVNNLNKRNSADRSVYEYVRMYFRCS